MILLHLIIGLILGKITGNYLPFLLGSIIPDIDHIYVLIKNKLYKPRLFIESIRHEEKYGIKYKTPLVHSVLGLILLSFAFYSIFGSQINTLYFSLAYLLHLLMDWPDKDIKYYLFPLKVEFKGFLPIWSKTEKIITVIGIILLIALIVK